MKIHLSSIILLWLFWSACGSEYSRCDRQLGGTCGTESDGEFCTFGYKFGESSTFTPNGISVSGPNLPGGIISYSFQTEEKTINYHRKNEVPTRAFDTKGDCARDKVREALSAWQMHIQLDFQEEPDNSNTPLKFYVADLESGNVGYPNFKDELCVNIAGQIIFNTNPIRNCKGFYLLSLHEIGHALGLGHVGSKNIMNPELDLSNVDGLLSGDILGMQSIYGAR